MATRNYSSTAQPTTLNGSISPSDVTCLVAATTGFPPPPFTLALDYGSISEELVDVTNMAGTTLTITRAVDGTAASSHNTGAIVRHVSSARDFREFQDHIADSTGVHGIDPASSVVGTTDAQTLSNKTLVLAQGTAQNLTLENKGATGTTSVIGDSTQPGVDRLRIIDNEVNLNVMVVVQSNGNIKSIKLASDTNNTYKFRLTDSNGSTDRWSVFAGGTMNLTATSSTTLPIVDITAPDLTNTKRSIRVAAAGGSSERFTVWNDGKVDIVGSDPTASTFDVTAPPAVSATYMRFMDSSLNVILSINSVGRTVANAGASVTNAFGTASNSVLRVVANTTSQTGNLQEWVDSTGAIAGFVSANGNATFPNGFTTVPFQTTSGVITAASGWSVTQQNAMKAFGMITIVANLLRTGADITVDASGNIAPDQDWFTVSGTWLPNAFFGASNNIPVPSTTGTGGGFGRMQTTGGSPGLVQLVSWNSNSTISTGANARIILTYHA